MKQVLVCGLLSVLMLTSAYRNMDNDILRQSVVNKSVKVEKKTEKKQHFKLVDKFIKKLNEPNKELAKLISENSNRYYLECRGYDRLGRKLDPNNTCGKSSWKGEKLTRKIGIIKVDGKSITFYNQRMTGCFNIHKDKIAPYTIEDCWVTDEGVKMCGPYVMCAAYTPIYEPGTLVETPFGIGIVVDYNGHCDLKDGTYRDLDICVVWGKEVPNQ